MGEKRELQAARAGGVVQERTGNRGGGIGPSHKKRRSQKEKEDDLEGMKCDPRRSTSGEPLSLSGIFPSSFSVTMSGCHPMALL